MAQPPDVPALRARIWAAYKSLQPLLVEMLHIRTFLRGSVYELKTRCGKNSCVCQRGQPKLKLRSCLYQKPISSPIFGKAVYGDSTCPS